VEYSTPAVYPTSASYAHYGESHGAYQPVYPTKPAEDTIVTSVVHATKIVTVPVVPVPASEYPAASSAPAPAEYSPYVPAAAHYSSVSAGKPAPSAPAQPYTSLPKPVYPSSVYYSAANSTATYATGTGKPEATKTGSTVPYFTGAASSVKVGGVLGGVVAAMFAVLL
jgi:hypothetical protein